MDLQKQLGEWYPLLSHVFETEWMQRLGRRLGASKWCQPSLEQVFRAFSLTPPDRVKVVIIGQDPYIKGEADGLAFSSFGKMTPSLEVMFSEINRTHKYPRTQSWLDDWASQGVLLLNAVLTTEMDQSRAHAGWGWENFTAEVLGILNKMQQPVVYMLWGRDAQSLLAYMPFAGWTTELRSVKRQQLVLKTCHPQAQNWNPANKFTGCNHFIDANLFLMRHDLHPIWWPDHKWLAGDNVYRDYCRELLKQIPDAKTYWTEKLYSHPAIPDKPHPHDDGLGSGHAETLPF